MDFVIWPGRVALDADADTLSGVWARRWVWRALGGSATEDVDDVGICAMLGPPNAAMGGSTIAGELITVEGGGGGTGGPIAHSPPGRYKARHLQN